MKTRSILLALALIIAVPSMTQAQVGNILRNKVGRVVNAGAKVLDKEANKKIDSAATKKAEEINAQAQEQARQNQEQAQQNQQQTQTQGETNNNSGNAKPGGINFGGLLGGGKVTSKYNETYNFNNRIYTEIEMYDKKDVTKMNYFIYFNDETADAGFESKLQATSDEGQQTEMTSTFIFDGANKSFMIMTDMGGMRIGIISDVPDESTTQDQQAAEKKPVVTITKTGNSRVIAGYKCDEYIYSDAESKEHGKMWATKDLKLKADKRTFSKAGLSAYYGSKELENSIVLAMEQYDKNDKLEMKSETKEVNIGFKHTMSTTGYSYRQMNFNQASAQQKK